MVSVPPKIDESMSPKTERDRLDVCYKHNNTFTIQLQPGKDSKLSLFSISYRYDSTLNIDFRVYMLYQY